jgi:hypothetical protein
MFEALKNRWAEARADVARKELVEIINRYNQLSLPDKYWVFSAFEATASSIDDNFGELANLSREQNSQLAKSIAESSRMAAKQSQNSFHGYTSRIGSMGGYLFSLYCEAQTLPGHDALAIIKQIDEWRKEAEAAHSESN